MGTGPLMMKFDKASGVGGGIAAVAAVLIGLGFTAQAAVPAIAASPGIKVYEDPANPVHVSAVFETGRCFFASKNGGGGFRLISESTNGRWDLHLRIGDWKGYGHHYLFHFGSRHPGSGGVGDGERFWSSGFEPPASPPLYPAGSVSFHKGGSMISMKLVAVTRDYNDAVLLDGKLQCARG